MSDGKLPDIADLLRQRNALDAKLSKIMNRPMTSGHLGEWIAEHLFDIAREQSASAKGIDGRFRSGPLNERSVNIKWYLKRENVLDIAPADGPDYYLVLIGPYSTAASSTGTTRPWVIDAVYLFATRQLLSELHDRGVQVGVATSVREQQWAAAQIFPASESSVFQVGPRQADLLRMFSTSAIGAEPETQK